MERNERRSDTAVGERIFSCLLWAARSGAEQSHDELGAAYRELAEWLHVVGLRAVTAEIGKLLSLTLVGVWDAGWQPAEVARQVRRRRRGPHEQLAIAAMSAGATWAGTEAADMPGAWAAQLEELGVSLPSGPGSADWVMSWMAGASLPAGRAVAVAIETLATLMTLPGIEPLLARPSEWRRPQAVPATVVADDAVLTKIRALLAKAESTAFEAESEALTAKAQQFMARHSIDDAVARARRPGQAHVSSGRPTVRRLSVDDPYAVAKSHLLVVVARANRVRCVWYGEFAMMGLVGYPRDLDAVEMLFISLLVQGSRAMLARGSVYDARGRSRTRSFRRSFLLAFAGRIGERLALAAVAARQEAETEMAMSLLPALAGSDREVDDAVAAAFPHLERTREPAITNEAGWRAGCTAAELATLGPEHGVLAAGGDPS